MGLSTAGADVGLDAVGAVGLFVSLHTADPGTDGSNEVTGGSPAYARQACTWDAASGGSMALAAVEEFDVPAASVSHFGVWSASTAGTFYGGGALSDTEVFAAQGTYKLKTGTTISIT